MLTIKQILTKYWGYSSFRPLQEDIIQSIMAGNDTLALLPTGGGKSLCYQVPALAAEGLCVVVSPLIALMRDQVEDLKARNIKAVALISGMHKREIDIALDNCIYGGTKFLYLSPERLQSEIVQVRLKKMQISIIAVDEAHCISQWGNDFRPSYLKIKDLRELTNAPVLALTATATPEVAKDIQVHLLFKKENILKGSFKRPNIAYFVASEDDKMTRLLKMINSIKGSGIIYVRSRKKTEELARQLNKEQQSADFFHAGLGVSLRNEKQTAWLTNRTRIIIATNAFGMGINKPDVRFVIHLDIPDSPEAYFQEAGRAGRDEKKAYAILLHNEKDKLDLEKNTINSFPSIEEIKQTYQALANYYQLAVGSSNNPSYDFNISAFCSRYNLKPLTVFNCIRFLEKEDYFSLSDNSYQPSRINIIVNKETLYEFQIKTPAFDNFIKLILRSYAGIFDGYVKINEYDLSQRAGIPREEVVQRLNTLTTLNIISYIPQNELPQVTFNGERIKAEEIQLSKENFSNLKLQALKRMEWMLFYVNTSHKCRSQLLLSYFGEHSDYRCGVCDVCLERNKLELSSIEFEHVSEQIKKYVNRNSPTLHDLVNNIHQAKEENILKVIRWLMDNGKLYYEEDRLKWKK